MNHRALVLVTKTTEEAEIWLLNNNFLRNTINCKLCIGIRMKLIIKKGLRIFRCKRCRTEASIYSETILFNCKKNLVEILDCLYFWSVNLLQTFCRTEINTKSCGTTQRWYDTLRLLCVKYMLNNSSEKIGGINHIVEIDECKFSKRKFHVGRMVRSAWVVGGIDVTSRESFYVEVLFRDAATLESVISEKVLPGTTIYTDSWLGYNGLSRLGYIHKKVNHKENFIDPITGANTQLIENSWSVFKKSLRSRYLNKRSDICSFFAEFLFKKRHGKETFLEVLRNIYE